MQGLFGSVECPPLLVSLDCDGDREVNENDKLIDDSDGNNILSPATLAAMKSLSVSPMTAYHEDLLSLQTVSLVSPSAIMQGPGNFLLRSPNLSPEISSGHQGRPRGLDTSSTFLCLEYVDSSTSLRPTASSSYLKGHKPVLDKFQVQGSVSLVQAPDVRKRDLQTISAVPTGSSEAVVQQLKSGLMDVNLALIDNTSAITTLNPATYSIEVKLSSSLTTRPIDADFSNNILTQTITSLDQDMEQDGGIDCEIEPTALKARTTEDIIADLRRPHKRQPINAGSSGAISDREDYDIGKKDDKSEVENDDGEEDANEVRPSTRVKKFSDRRRRMNAIADQHILSWARQIAQKDNDVKPEDEARQSARWLVNQAENREIISSPREYQTELFERAKEKNIIAVLDTGTSRLSSWNILLTTIC